MINANKNVKEFMKKIVSILLFILLVFMACSCSQQVIDPSTLGKFEPQDTYGNVPDTASDIEYDNIVAIDPRETTVSFLAVGDNIIYNGQLREGLADGKNKEGAEYDFSAMYKNVAEIVSSYDLAFVNQETPLAGKEFGYSQYPKFNSPQELGDNLIEAGFDIFNIATNHMLDVGSDGYKNTMEYFRSKDVMMVGGYDDADDLCNVRIIEKNGIRIAVAGFTYGTNGKRPTSDTFIPYIYGKDKLHYSADEQLVDSELMIRWVELASQSADVVIVSMHWGNEYTQKPTSEQRRLAKLLCNAGVDVILGHHTHCIQPIEWIEGKDGNRTLCFFSLGNFTSETDETVSLVGGLASFNIILNERDGVRIDSVGFRPTVMDYRNSFNKNTVYLLENYSDELCRGHNIVSYFKKALNMDILHSYVENIIDEKYLPQSYLDSLS